jgi:hypothetical protein
LHCGTEASKSRNFQVSKPYARGPILFPRALTHAFLTRPTSSHPPLEGSETSVACSWVDAHEMSGGVG